MLLRLLPLCLLSAAVASGQISVPPPAVPAPQPNSAVLTPADRQQVIRSITGHLQKSYILPDTAKQMITALQARVKQGAYNDITDSVVFAARLTIDLQSVSHDRHIRVDYVAEKLPQETDPPNTQEAELYRNSLDRTNCGFRHAELLQGNIGYVQLNYFGPRDVCAAAAAVAMRAVSHADAIIFDMRLNHGGDPGMVALLASYLFDQPTHLDDLYSRYDHTTTHYWADPKVVSDRMPTQPVYVLTSRGSFSGAEQFCYDLRNLRRATIIGERTGGAAHPTRNRRLSDHFLIAMPEYRYINAVTRTDWEGEGVAPDVSVSPWNALIIARKLAVDRIEAGVADPNHPTSAEK
jgi:C-terminal processing protease CtpA/Prc